MIITMQLERFYWPTKSTGDNPRQSLTVELEQAKMKALSAGRTSEAEKEKDEIMRYFSNDGTR